MEETQTVQEVAIALGLSPVVIQEWAATLWPGEPMRDASGRQRLSLEQVRIIEILHAMKGEERGINTITRIIGPIQFHESPPLRPADPPEPLGVLEDKLRRLQAENQKLKAILALPWWRQALFGRRLLVEVLTRTMP